MNQVTRVAATTLLILLLGVSRQVVAHHSYAATYLADQRVEITGELVVFMYRNPHSVLQLMVVGSDGEASRWACEWAGTRALDNGGITSMTLKPGDKLVVKGFPGRNADVKRLLVTEIRRPSDGWSWSGDSSQ
jgi:hypothetical protein